MFNIHEIFRIYRHEKVLYILCNKLTYCGGEGGICFSNFWYYLNICTQYIYF